MSKILEDFDDEEEDKSKIKLKGNLLTICSITHDHETQQN
jgi:hypothetical protein